MGAMASQITSITIVYSTVYSGADQGKHQSFASYGEFTGDRWILCTNGQQRGKCFLLMTSSCESSLCFSSVCYSYANIGIPFQVNIIVVIGTMIVMLSLVGLSIYKSPVTSLIGVAVFAAGLPLYYLGQLALKSETVGHVSGKWNAVESVLSVKYNTCTCHDANFGINAGTDVDMMLTLPSLAAQ